MIKELPEAMKMNATMRMSDIIKELLEAKDVQKQHAVDIQKWIECGHEMRNELPRHRQQGYSESDSGFPAHRERFCRSSRQYERYDEDE